MLSSLEIRFRLHLGYPLGMQGFHLIKCKYFSDQLKYFYSNCHQICAIYLEKYKGKCTVEE